MPASALRPSSCRPPPLAARGVARKPVGCLSGGDGSGEQNAEVEAVTAGETVTAGEAVTEREAEGEVTAAAEAEGDGEA